ncbi:aminoacyl-tRNA hydrolase [Terrilactibacillus sp. BCM23-1]|uniref:Peptidyl-tRNA hydrolase n=1 Tax=Terrilactibacillus tamarindi TaxID=2599694 RepID=A0A6N8CUH4_9BACI|nr:aminoacyl-tRNA hydrolase [Terrilactibacillus tamarindi]MTT32987.1 aminoacyl-tRNA hydrolase [Terrilactibacillus tamarindi]
MKVIVGLGNIGSEFDHTRHNIGFEVIDYLANQYHLPLSKTKFNAMYGKGIIEGEECLLVKPLTYMNRSGEAVAPILKFFKVSVDDLIVVYDDLDLPIGKIRLRQKGSAGGHNGIKSIISHLQTQDFKRIKIGIGRPDGREKVVNYVLQRFSKEQMIEMSPAIERAAEAIVKGLNLPFVKVMNTFN